MNFRFKDARVGPKLLLAFAVISGLTVGTALASIYSFSKVVRTERTFVNSALPAVELADRMSHTVERIDGIMAEARRSESLRELEERSTTIVVELAEMRHLMSQLRATTVLSETTIVDAHAAFQAFDGAIELELEQLERLRGLELTQRQAVRTLGSDISGLLDVLGPARVHANGELERLRMSRGDGQATTGALFEIVGELDNLTAFELRLKTVEDAVATLALGGSEGAISRARSIVSLNMRVLVRRAPDITDESLRAATGLGLSRVVASLNDEAGAFEVSRRVAELGRISRASAADSLATISVLRVLIDDLVTNATSLTQQAIAASRAAVSNGQNIVVGLATLSVLVSMLIVWIYVFRSVVTRLNLLTDVTRRLASGDLETTVPRLGHDELADMAAAVDHFKSNAVKLRDQEETLRRTNADLLQREADLERSNAELEQFAYLASHDLQEPLRMVASFCDLLQERYGDEIGDEGKQYVRYAVDGAERMRSLIDDLLRYSRVGQAEIPDEVVDLSACCENAVHALGPAIRENGARIEWDELPTVRGSESLINQVFQNLIGNSLKFRNEDPPVVRITSRRDDGAWTILVADNGVGIEDEHADRVFKIFQRLHRRDEVPGNGLGLSLCKRIVNLHGGEIGLETARGSGTTVRFSFPDFGARASEQVMEKR